MYADLVENPVVFHECLIFQSLCGLFGIELVWFWLCNVSEVTLPSSSVVTVNTIVFKYSRGGRDEHGFYEWKEDYVLVSSEISTVGKVSYWCAADALRSGLILSQVRLLSAVHGLLPNYSSSKLSYGCKLMLRAIFWDFVLFCLFVPYYSWPFFIHCFWFCLVSPM